MFQRFWAFVLLLTLLSLVPVAPAKAQDLEPEPPEGVPQELFDMLKDTVYSPDQSCNPSCLSVSVWVSCAPPNYGHPPTQGSQHYFTGIWGPYWRGRWIPQALEVFYDNRYWRIYSFTEENAPVASYYALWREGAGTQSSFYNGFPVWKTPPAGGYASWTFYFHNGGLC